MNKIIYITDITQKELGGDEEILRKGLQINNVFCAIILNNICIERRPMMNESECQADNSTTETTESLSYYLIHTTRRFNNIHCTQ
jgi:hypothetical protein